MYELRVKDHFDAAHYIADYKGKCHRMHGHRWEVEVCVQGINLDKLNMLIDFSVVKKKLSELTDLLDHFVLNDRLETMPGIAEPNVTAELLSEWFYRGLCNASLNVKSVTIWESPECSITYKRE